MKLWLIWQTVNNGWDTYDSAVVCAETEKEAKLIHPSKYIKKWNGKDTTSYSSWTHVKNVKCKLIGEALEGTKAGVVLASFGAG